VACTESNVKRRPTVKNAAVVVAGSTRGPQNVTIQPGTTAHDILSQLGLEGYLLSTKGATTYFGDDENLYPKVVDGDLLYATTEAEVGVI
jgi:hypothetical protein